MALFVLSGLRVLLLTRGFSLWDLLCCCMSRDLLWRVGTGGIVLGRGSMFLLQGAFIHMASKASCFGKFGKMFQQNRTGSKTAVLRDDPHIFTHKQCINLGPKRTKDNNYIHLQPTFFWVHFSPKVHYPVFPKEVAQKNQKHTFFWFISVFSQRRCLRYLR